MDAVIAFAPPPQEAMWTTFVQLLLFSEDDAMVQATITKMDAAGRRALLKLEARHRMREVDSLPSLHEVRDLLDTSSFHPFIVDQRKLATQLRILLRGGCRKLFGHELYRSACPHCYASFPSVPHLLRDCKQLGQLRQLAYSNAQQYLRSIGAKGTAVTRPTTDNQHFWYLLKLGAAGPNHFLGFHLDRKTHFARGEGVSTTSHVRSNLVEYRRVLGCLAKFLVPALDDTAAKLGLQTFTQQYRRKCGGFKWLQPYVPQAAVRKLPKSKDCEDVTKQQEEEIGQINEVLEHDLELLDSVLLL